MCWARGDERAWFGCKTDTALFSHNRELSVVWCLRLSCWAKEVLNKITWLIKKSQSILIKLLCFSNETTLLFIKTRKDAPFKEKCFHCSTFVWSLLWKVMNWLWYTTKCEKKGNYFKATNVKKPRTPNSRAMSQENTDGKKSIGICLSVISCVLLYFFLLKVYSSSCSALRMHTCGATMIHILTTFGDDSNQKTWSAPNE